MVSDTTLTVGAIGLAMMLAGAVMSPPSGELITVGIALCLIALATMVSWPKWAPPKPRSPRAHICPLCQGLGKDIRTLQPCARCHGAGRISL